jgi:UDPglucose 6-dehydrogenase
VTKAVGESPGWGLDLARAKDLLARPLLIDLRNLYSRSDVEKQGFEYVAVGR